MVYVKAVVDVYSILNKLNVFEILKIINRMPKIKELSIETRSKILTKFKSKKKECRKLIGTVIQNPTISPNRIAVASNQLIAKIVSGSALCRRIQEINKYTTKIQL